MNADHVFSFFPVAPVHDRQKVGAVDGFRTFLDIVTEHFEPGRKSIVEPDIQAINGISCSSRYIPVFESSGVPVASQSATSSSSLLSQ